jgi:hypothetical protein
MPVFSIDSESLRKKGTGEGSLSDLGAEKNWWRESLRKKRDGGGPLSVEDAQVDVCVIMEDIFDRKVWLFFCQKLCVSSSDAWVR